MEPLLQVRNLSKSIAGKQLFENTTFEIYPEDCIGLLGSNGCGKTTLFNILLGNDQANSGDILKKDGLKIRFLEQDPMHRSDITLNDFFTRNAQTNSLQQQIKHLEHQLEDPKIYETNRHQEILEQLRALQTQTSKTNGTAQLEAARERLEDLGLSNLTTDMQMKKFSGGERQKIALASLLTQPQNCDLFLLDEPTNHLDIETIEWLEQTIADIPSAVVIISHDRYLLNDLVDRIFEFHGSSIELYTASFEEYEEQKKIREHIKQQEYQKASIEMKRQLAAIKKITRRNRYNNQINSRMKQFDKLKHVENPVLKNYLLRFHFKTALKSGKNIADGTNISKYFGDKRILSNANFEIFAGQKIGLIGPNGCGKTTFLKMLTREETPSQGKISLSQGAKWGYFDQGHLSLNLENTLLEEILRGHIDLAEEDAKALLGQFNFKGPMIQNKVGQLSGGERARLSFLRLIMEPYNFLLLDEPTNHMDIESKTAIETALNSFDGTVIVVSHDRKFLDTVTDTIFFMIDADIKSYSGNYTMFRQQRLKELSQYTDRDLAYISSHLTKYVVTKGFTIWTIKKKHIIGEEIIIGDHNRNLYEWAIKGGLLKEI
ncbi:MAG: ATP-binding cassette domain-containing protein [Candidatus Thermoplasmatota archaeon]|jgi:ATP-binding cassette subfamily F protein 3|nr:ATP-binding cassette domain-containing protein [Candidatus Thermoplasmatota archaeon]